MMMDGTNAKKRLPNALVLERAEKGEILLGLGKPITLSVKKVQSIKVGVGLWVLWLIGLFVPLTILMPIGFQTGNSSLINAGIILAVVAGFPAVNIFCLVQAKCNVDAFEKEEKERYEELSSLVDAWVSADASKQDRFKSAIRGVLKENFDKVKFQVLSKLHVMPFCGKSDLCRRLWWNSDILRAVCFVCFFLLPLLVFLPIAYANVDLSYDFSRAQMLAVSVPILFVLTFVYLFSTYRNFSRYRAARMNKRELRGSIAHRSNLVAETEPVAKTFYNLRTLPEIAHHAVTFIPWWVHWEIVRLWLFILFPFAFLLTLTNFVALGGPVPVSSEYVKTTLKSVAFIFIAVYMVFSLLFWSISRHLEVLHNPEAEIAELEEQLESLRWCKEVGCEISKTGDYPHFSIGEGIVTRGRQQISKTGFTIVVNRLYANMILIVAVPVVLLSILINVLPLVTIQSTLTFLLIVLIFSPLVAFIFYATKMLWDVIPRPQKRGAPWIIAWFLSCCVLPPLISPVLLAFNSVYSYVGFVILAWPLFFFFCASILIIWREWKHLKVWGGMLRVEKHWLSEITSVSWKVSLACVTVLDILLLILSRVLSTSRLAGVSLAFSMVSNVFLFVYLLTSILNGMAKSNAGIQKLLPFLSVTIRWFIFVSASLNISLQASHRDETLSLTIMTSRFSDFSFTLVLLAALTLWFHLVRVHVDYKSKVLFGYFPENWELITSRDRPVCEAASKVILYETDDIEEDLRKRGKIELDPRVLLKMYLESQDEVQRRSLKNRFISACYAPGYSRAELEAMLETAIQEDVERLKRLEKNLTRDVLAKEEMYDKLPVMRAKFQGCKAKEVLEMLQREEEALAEEKETTEPDDVSDKRKGKWRRLFPNFKMEQEKGVLAVAKSGDSEATAGKESTDSQSFSTWRSKVESASGNSTFVDLIEELKKYPDYHAYEVALLDQWIQRIYIPRSRLGIIGEESPYSRQNYLIILDSARFKILLIGYLTWRITEIPLHRVLHVETKQYQTSAKRAVQIKLTYLRPATESCLSSDQPKLRTHNLYFQNVAKLKAFWRNFSRMAISAGTVSRGEDSAQFLFKIDERGRVYQEEVDSSEYGQNQQEIELAIRSKK